MTRYLVDTNVISATARTALVRRHELIAWMEASSPTLFLSAITIAEIADSAGFADQSYFDKRFKKSFGQSPRQFRERQRTAGENRPKT